MFDFSYLSTLADDDFERERERLICAVINEARSDQRIMLQSLQSALDVHREQMTSDQFIQLCFRKMFENLQTLQASFTDIQSILAGR